MTKKTNMRLFFTILSNIILIFLLLLFLPLGLQCVGEFRVFFWPNQGRNVPVKIEPPPSSLENHTIDRWYNPYTTSVPNQLLQPTQWLLANFHVHSSHFEGELSAEELLHQYHQRGYQILAISDHQWITNIHNPFPDLLLFRAFEHGININKFHFGIIEPTEYFWDWFPFRQRKEHLLWETQQFSSHSSFLVLNHPSCTLGKPISSDVIISLPGIQAMELASHWACGDPFFHNLKLWDELWQKGKRLWAMGGDDSHHRSTIGIGATLIYSEKKKHKILEALNQGRMITVTDANASPLILPTTFRFHSNLAHSSQQKPFWELELSELVDEIQIMGPNLQVLVSVEKRKSLIISNEQVRSLPFFRVQYKKNQTWYFMNPVFQKSLILF